MYHIIIKLEGTGTDSAIEPKNFKLTDPFFCVGFPPSLFKNKNNNIVLPEGEWKLCLSYDIVSNMVSFNNPTIAEMRNPLIAKLDNTEINGKAYNNFVYNPVINGKYSISLIPFLFSTDNESNDITFKLAPELWTSGQKVSNFLYTLHNIVLSLEKLPSESSNAKLQKNAFVK